MLPKALLFPGSLCFALSIAHVWAANESPLTVTPVGSSLEIPATLVKPDGAGPFPAIVYMHDCSGLGPRSSGTPRRWSRDLVAQGYVVLIPDSFTPRGFADGVCLIAGAETTSASGYARAADAYGALAALRALPFVDGKRVGVMGNSHGGWTVLAAMAADAEVDSVLREAKRNGFAAALALYPSCSARYGGWWTARAPGTRFGPAVSFNGTYRPLAFRPRRNHGRRPRRVGRRAETGRCLFRPAPEPLTRTLSNRPAADQL